MKRVKTRSSYKRNLHSCDVQHLGKDPGSTYNGMLATEVWKKGGVRPLVLGGHLEINDNVINYLKFCAQKAGQHTVTERTLQKDCSRQKSLSG